MRDDLFHRADWNRESNAGAGATGRVDGGVYADQLAKGVEQRATRIAGINRCIGLNYSPDFAATGGLNLPTERTHHTHCQCGVEPKRVANGEHFASNR